MTTDQARWTSVASVTIRDVADRAGVSIKTVSRVMNAERSVSPDTRSRVLAVAKALDYRPNVSARSLAGARAYVLGLVFDNPNANYVAGIQLGAAAACRAAGYHLMVEALDASVDDVAAAVRALISAVRTDGLILTPPISDNLGVIAMLEASGLPFVRLASSAAPERGARVHMDDRKAAYDVTVYLLGLGHRRISFVRGRPDHASSWLRFEGFSQAMRDHGAPVAETSIEQGWFTFQSGADCAERMLTAEAPPTAVFASNDDMALGVLSVASRLGLSVPGKISIAGFDDTPAAQVIWPRLTTVRQPLAAMAAAAVELLITRRAPSGGAPSQQRLPFEIVIRESTGPAP